ncbi:hypothetical protein AA103196_2329 [Ameyamaea chiangmaiensis NBRC 103196]|uniref:DUF2501 domain-containing protein n=1 Tax=Ameyamaea chiangmaiensis TaxID=442969 RepID=A0A850PGM5_9PROT|nr:DUF2501 domain-containing protein [Ameyamaea chiangmaiensis]MBS4075412.1 DUF2501 domain-containing protein [Ameyamaea chiangmaiensis]NVN40321.1 DUF2501 domain-containing protein [Ameyamaea chiangmaiensis]GBQ69846.1 hypothetical protein AA103196_2329 [Ameyamaea chiangmaiensis NBRC 103196]
MSNRSLATLSFACAIAAAGISSAHAQQTVPQLPSGAVTSYAPSGTVGVQGTAPQATNGAQIVRNVTGVNPATAGAGVPDISTLSNGNVAGLLSYCVRSHTLNDTTSRHVARAAAKHPGVTTDQGYSLGGQGLIQINGGNPVDVSTMSTTDRTKLCSDLTKHAQGNM